jgi:hypothetical protein
MLKMALRSGFPFVGSYYFISRLIVGNFAVDFKMK